MASRHGKRKIAKSSGSKRRTNARMQDDEFEEAFELDNISANEKLIGEFSTGVRRSSPRRSWLLIGLFIGLCLLTVLVAGLLALKIHTIFHTDTDTDEDLKTDPSVTDPVKSDPRYGLSTEKIYLQHRPPSLTRDAVRRASNAVNVADLKSQELGPLLIPRIPGTPGSLAARTHIINRLSNLGWNVEQDTSQAWAPAPFGLTSFTNVIATANPAVKRRLVLACHYDSKYFAEGEFIGATDSALPCAQLLYLARILDGAIKQANSTNPPVTLQLLFFDGEEAFVQWTDTDSLYGSRNLATVMENTAHPPGATNTNLLHGIDMFVLLDLLGVRNPSIPDYFQSTTTWYDRMANIEQRLKRLSLTSRYSNNYFNGQRRYNSRMQDDHIPFLQRGVRVLHLIPSRFPSVWHTLSDNAEALDDPTISNLSKILHVFVAEYLSLAV